MKIGGLCFGYGGLDLAVAEVLGAELAWYSEIDAGACKVAAHRFPGVPNVGDMTTVDWTRVEPVDVITGGTPCQDLSHAGKRGGMSEGTRSNLWVAMREAIAALRPALVVWENVRGALSAPADSEVERGEGLLGVGRPGPYLRAAGRVVGDLAGLGYDASWCGLPASGVGAPHGRWRVFVAAADAQRGRRDGWAPDPVRRPVGRDAAAGRGEVALLPTPAVNDMGASYTPAEWDEWTARMQAAHGNGNGHGKSLSIEAQRLLPTPRSTDIAHIHVSERAKALYSSGPMIADVIDANNWGQYAAAIARWEHVLGRPAPPPTQPSRKGTPQLSARFSEWLMGLPDGWVTDVPGITRNEALRALGNGVVPQQAATALRYLLAVQEATP